MLNLQEKAHGAGLGRPAGWVAFVGVAVLIGPACGGDDNKVVAQDTVMFDADSSDTATSDAPVGLDIDRDSVVTFDVPSGEDAAPPPRDVGGGVDAGDRGFGSACNGNTDCESGWCVEGPTGYVCTSQCLETCPDGYDCKSVQNNGGDVTFLCLPRVQRVCTPCLEDFQCNGGACLAIDGNQRCASRCEDNDECPVGYMCEADAGSTDGGTYCKPKSGSCDCTPVFDGVQRTCTLGNALGTCFGVETCRGEIGWVGCNAREPVPETCNYVDDDCDGGVDNTFKTPEGVYGAVDACGSCTTDCAETVPNASEADCAVAAGVARCRVVTCEAGYVQLNEYVCVPDAGNLCQACTVDAECAGVGARCVTLDDGRFCGRACAATTECAEGFVCAEAGGGGGGESQCVPASGSCTCDGSNTALARSCSVSYMPPGPNAPVVTCQGFEQCTANGWGECGLPTEFCDGIDNDCDGGIDEDYRTGDKYTALEHCGACRVNCASLTRPNTVPLCDTNPAVPRCSYTCAGDAVDVNGISDDGCECVPAAGPDLVGDGVDSNCDGIDGEVDNGIFVSRDGAPTNPGTRELPLSTISAGLTLARQDAKRDVYVATGVYSENIVLEEGVGLFGGYSPFFDARSVAQFETAIIGQAPTSARPATVTAQNVGNDQALTVMDGFSVFGPNASNIPGGNSYAVYVRNSGQSFTFAHNRVFAGSGGPGVSGSGGGNGNRGGGGGTGADARDTAGCPPALGSAGGAGGSNTCSSNISGGNGGLARCPSYGTTPAASGAGDAGRGALRGQGGAAGWDMFVCQGGSNGCFVAGGIAATNCGACYFPPDNNPFDAKAGTNGGAGTDGARGLGCSTSAGAVVGGHWRGNAGSAGGDGLNGAGGGGGGAGGGVEVSGTSCADTNGDDDVGGSGGGGGAAGCRGTAGTAGTAGGGSFGVFYARDALGTVPVIRDNAISGGTGGPGASGASGGVGGTGGAGGSGGIPGNLLTNDLARCASGGGAGGSGGRGGHGGGGGGGCGGASYALFVSVVQGLPPGVWKTGNSFPSAGVGGGGGGGGPSVIAASSGTSGVIGTAAATNF